MEHSQKVLDDEIVLMESIYPGEFLFRTRASNPLGDASQFHVFTMEIHPSTAGDRSQQNISVVLHLLIPAQYPMECPKVSFLRPRGLSELQLVALLHHLDSEAAKRIGSAMIYDLIDIVKDYLTCTNFPMVECPFCLCEITEGDQFYKTPCFHYYHRYCLNQYLEFLQTDKECTPEAEGLLRACIVCREPLSNVLSIRDQEKTAIPPSIENSPDKFAASDGLVKDRQWREQLFTKQKNKKGIIVPDEGDHFVVTLQHTPEVLRTLEVSTETGSSDSPDFGGMKIPS